MHTHTDIAYTIQYYTILFYSILFYTHTDTHIDIHYTHVHTHRHTVCTLYTHPHTHRHTDSNCITSFTVTEFPKIPTVVDEVDYSCTGHITYHGNYIHTMVTIYIPW